MTTYDFQRCSVLLVEDNEYIAKIFKNILKSFKFGDITSVANGEEAISFLKNSKSSLSGGCGVDLIISDLVMTPINGLLLLRWVRASKDCPNRMIPFMMISGAADEEYVNSARDLGVTEFLAKPFSVQSIYKHLLQLVDRPRQFVTGTTYYGPDRRRKVATNFKEKDRRVQLEENITVVYSAGKVFKPDKNSNVWYWKLPNTLQAKVAGGAVGTNTRGELPLDLLEQAEEQLERSGLDFLEWAQEYLETLSGFCKKALNAKGSRSETFAEIHNLSLELRGQGGTFGYPLITDISKMLYECTNEGCAEDDTAVEIVQHHIDSMRAVLRGKIAGDGGDVGLQLVEGLKQSIKKIQSSS